MHRPPRHVGRLRSPIPARPLRWLAVVATAAATLVLASGRAGYAGTPLYPDLQTLSPADLRFDVVTIDGTARKVLRFSNAVANLGEGPLELQGTLEQGNGGVQVVQQVSDQAGTAAATHPVGTLVYHAEHKHWHFENFA